MSSARNDGKARPSRHAAVGETVPSPNVLPLRATPTRVRRIPTREEFSEWLQLGTTRMPWGDDCLPEPGALTHEAAVSHLAAAVGWRGELQEQMRRLPAGAWLEAQEGYQRARAIVHGARKGTAPKAMTKAQFLRARVSAMWDQAAREPAPQQTFHNFVAAAGGDDHTNHWQWNCMLALAEYFHVPDRPAAVHQAAKRFSDAAAALQRAVDEFLLCADDLNDYEIAEASVELPADLPAQLGEVSAGRIGAPDRAHFPLGRLDEQASERLFVYRVWCANMQQTQSPKAEAIFELMMIDGFRSRYADVDSIERLCADFKKRRTLWERAKTGR